MSKNGNQVPRCVSRNSNKKFHFTCEICNHDFMKHLYTLASDKWCPFCSNKKLCEDSECKKCFNNSFASHPKSLYWHPTKNENEMSRNVFRKTHKAFWFNCETCKHDFIMSIYTVTSGKWCPFCSSKKLCEDSGCKKCFNNSFASHPKSSCWHPYLNKDKVPRSIAKHSNKKYYLICDTCKHELYVPINRVANGHWCAKCKNKTECKLYNFLKQIYPSIVHQFKQDWCINKKHLPFDFCIPEKKVIIELDGPQHFIQVSNWKSPEKCLENDIFKHKCANKNGYSVVRIIQDDVWFDRYDWLAKLQETLENIGDRENVFLCQNHEYDTLQSALIQAC